MNEKKPDAAPKRDTIPVAEVLIGSQEPIDLPGKRVATSLRTTPRDQIFNNLGERINNVPAWELDYVPAMRALRVVHYPVEGKPPRTIFMPLEHVKWFEPATEAPKADAAAKTG